MYEYEKKKDFLCLLLSRLCLIQTRDCLGDFGEDDSPTVECKVIGNIDWNGFINDFMKEIHII